VVPNFHAEKRTDLDQPLQKLEQLEQAIEETLAEAIPPKSRWRVAARILGWALLALYFLFSAALLLITLSATSVAVFVSFILQAQQEFGYQTKLVVIVVAGWCVLIQILPGYFVYSAFRNRRKARALYRQSVELEDMIEENLEPHNQDSQYDSHLNEKR